MIPAPISPNFLGPDRVSCGRKIAGRRWLRRHQKRHSDTPGDEEPEEQREACANANEVSHADQSEGQAPPIWNTAPP